MSKTSKQTRFLPHRQRGLSLVELLLALALGLIVVTGIVQLFVGNSQTYGLINGQSRMQENARYSMEFISRAARNSGFFGCAPEADNVVRGLRGNWANIPEFDLTQTVQGFNGNADGTWTPALTTLPRTEGASNFNVHTEGNGIDTNEIAVETDVLVLRSVGGQSQQLTEVLQPTAEPKITAPGGDSDFEAGDIIFISDCEQGAMARVTNVVPGADEATLQLATTAAGSFFENPDTIEGPTGFVPFTLSFLGRSYGAETTVGAVETTIFFIAPSAGVDNQGNTPNALWQKAGTDGPVELVQGVDDLQVRYGIDTTLADGIANANQYVEFDAVPDVNQIVSIRVTVAVNSIDAVTDDGQRLERTFSKTISMRNANPEA
jgi:type IV pilus assembly protein PilW